MKIKIIKMLQINYFKLIILFAFLIGCSIHKSEHDRLIKIIKLESTFKNKSIIRSRGQNYILYNFYDYNKINKYTYDIDTDQLLAIGDSTQVFSNIKKDLKNLLTTMDSFEIRDVSSEFKENGIDLKFYLKSGESLLYVPDIKVVSNPNWKIYLTNLKKVNPNWYLDNNVK